jgi:hypothetical protein
MKGAELEILSGGPLLKFSPEFLDYVNAAQPNDGCRLRGR